MFKNISNSELIKRYTRICFLITKHPSNKAYSREFEKLYIELCKRLKLSQEEVEKIII